MNPTAIRDRAARLAVIAFKHLKRTAEFKHKNDEAVTVVCDWSTERSAGGELLGADTVELTRTFYIPRQTDFPPAAGIAPDDLITAEGREYRVLQSDDGGIGAMYTIETQFVRAWKLGANSK